tara:strand:- start:4468 stop:7704 length:3237 start_codon:yes stop_codon:yes gene_type:complete
VKGIIKYFVNHKIPVNILIIFFIVFGIAGTLALKSSFFPLIKPKYISINFALPGGSPSEIEEGVVLKIEDNLEGIAGIERVTSTSRENSGSILIETNTDYEIDAIILEVKNAVDKVSSFPIDLEPVIVSKIEEQEATVIFSLTGYNIDLLSLKNISKKIENDLRDIDGISQIKVSGFPDEEIEIAINDRKLIEYELTFADISKAVKSSNILISGGNIKTNDEEYLIRSNNKNYYANELNDIVINNDNEGGIIRLGDVAVIRDQFSETSNSSFVDLQSAVIISVSSTSSEDLLDSAKKINLYIDDFNFKNNELKLTLLRDYSIVLKQRTNLLLENGGIGILLVLILLSIFLNIRLAFWVAFSIPISFLGMLIFAEQFDITINLMSLFGMIVVIGILVDDGIVIAENIYRHYEKGKTPKQAAIDGTLEVLPAIVSAIVTTIIAFSTLLLLDGDVGNYFGEVAMIVILTLLISLIEALLLLPAHLANSKALKDSKKNKNSKTFDFFAFMRNINQRGYKIMNWLRDFIYTPLLKFSLKYRFFSLSGFIVALMLTISSVQGGIIGLDFFPTIASDIVTVDLKMPYGTNEKKTDSIISYVESKVIEAGKELEYIYMKDDERNLIEYINKNIGLSADNMSMIVGFGDVGGSSTASLEIYMLDSEERPQSLRASMLAKLIREKTGEIVGAEKFIVNDAANFGGSPVSISIMSNNVSELKSAKIELVESLKSNPSLTDVSHNDPEGTQEINIKLKEDANQVGLSLVNVMSQVRSAFFGSEVQRLQRGDDEVKIWIRFDKISRSSIQTLDDMKIITPSGNRVPLREIASYEIKRGDIAINHLDGKREIQINANLSDPNISAADIVFELQNNLIPEIKNKFSSLNVSFEGQYREANKTIKSAYTVFPLALFLIFTVIGFTFRTYSQPFLLLMLIPFSLTTVAWGHLFHNFPVNVISLLGIIALIGILVNDGLVFISKFNSNLKEGMSFDESLFIAGRERFRAIFLTSVTTIAGLAPIILEKSFQAQLLKPMAISIAYGIGYATLLTLILLPIMLSVTNSIKVSLHWLYHGEKIAKREIEAPVIEQNIEE